MGQLGNVCQTSDMLNINSTILPVWIENLKSQETKDLYNEALNKMYGAAVQLLALPGHVNKGKAFDLTKTKDLRDAVNELFKTYYIGFAGRSGLAVANKKTYLETLQGDTLARDFLPLKNMGGVMRPNEDYLFPYLAMRVATRDFSDFLKIGFWGMKCPVQLLSQAQHAQRRRLFDLNVDAISSAVERISRGSTGPLAVSFDETTKSWKQNRARKPAKASKPAFETALAIKFAAETAQRENKLVEALEQKVNAVLDSMPDSDAKAELVAAVTALVLAQAANVFNTQRVRENADILTADATKAAMLGVSMPKDAVLASKVAAAVSFGGPYAAPQDDQEVAALGAAMRGDDHALRTTLKTASGLSDEQVEHVLDVIQDIQSGTVSDRLEAIREGIEAHPKLGGKALAQLQRGGVLRE